MTLHSFAQRAIKTASANSPIILTALGVAGTVTTAVLTGKACVKADRILQKAQFNNNLRLGNLEAGKNYPLETREKLELVWKDFIPAGISLVGTVACIICANRIGTRRAAAMAAAYTLSEKAFVEYKDRVIDHIGDNKERAIRDDIAKSSIQRNPPASDMVIIGGQVIFHEAFTGRYFQSTMEEVKSAVNRVNHHMMQNFSADLNDFYDFVGLDRTDMGDMLGWNSDKLIELQFTTVMTDDQKPAISFSYKTPPREGYFRNSM